MFYIKSKLPGVSFEGVWANSLSDDFLRYVPDHFTKVSGVVHTKEDLDVSLIDENESLLKSHVASENKDIKVVAGEVFMGEMKQLNDDVIFDAKTKCKLKKLKKWPYDDKGKFLGNEAE